MQQETSIKKYDKIEGWLLLVGLGIIIAPLRIIYFVTTVYAKILTTTGFWARLATPGDKLYDPLWHPLLIGEMAASLISFILSIWLIILFMNHKKVFPKIFIIFLCFDLFYVVVDHIFAQMIPYIADKPDAKTIGKIAGVSLAAIIWVPYMLKSQRVKGTFTR